MQNKRRRDEKANLEKEKLLNPEKLLAKKKQKRRKKIAVVLISIFLFIGIICGSFQMVRAIGKNHLQKESDTARPDLTPVLEEIPLTKEEETKWQEGWVKYKDKIYEYNEDILTFLIMGIDKNSDVKEVAEGTNGGQADALFLVVMNQKEKNVKIIAVNRNTMTDVAVYNEEGAYVTTLKAQIATQHGFGNGVEESCKYQKEAVEKLFYQLPIHGYAAINMSAIATINDAVGGVDVTVLEDLTRIDKTLVKDKQVHLSGDSAFWYVKYRDVNTFASSDMRMARQKQYLNAFLETAKAAAKKDVSIVLNLYQAIMPQMVTDISADEVAYLAPILTEYQFSMDSIYTMQGETVMGEQFEEFYPDEKALYEMILEVFYEEVEQ